MHLKILRTATVAVTAIANFATPASAIKPDDAIEKITCESGPARRFGTTDVVRTVPFNLRLQERVLIIEPV